MAERDEIETIACFHDREVDASSCRHCFGARRRPLRDRGFLWADGVWRKDRPPSEEPIAVKPPNGDARPLPEPRQAQPGKRKPVPKSFQPTARTRLRQEALSLAISAASVMYRHGTVTGDQIIGDAEAIERMPPVSKRMIIQPERVVDAVIRALARGKPEITVPRMIAAGYVVRTLAPGFMRRNTKRATIAAVAKRARR
jgi:hypothetical protein